MLKVISMLYFILRIHNWHSSSFTEKGKCFIDFKYGKGDTGVGEPVTKPDVTISMTEEMFLQIFNMETNPDTAFLFGKIKVSGSIAKALLLKDILKAAAVASKNAKNWWKLWKHRFLFFISWDVLI